MKIRSQNSKLNCYTKLKSSAKLSFMRCFVASRLAFMSLSFLTFMTDMVFADSTVGNSQTLPQTLRTNPNSLQRPELIRAEISLPKDWDEEESKNKLKRMIEQVRSVQFESQVQAIETPIDHYNVPVLKSNETLSDMPPPRQEEVEEIKIGQPYERVSDQTLKILKDLLQHPDKLNDPLELGEILFFSGHTKDAVPFYQEALKRMDLKDISLSRDRAWILFQMGNCLRNHELTAAAEIYRKLLIEYPNSPWTDLAKAQRELIAWRLKERPNELIAEPEYVGSQGNRH
jgi:tetratricopeptide (TPR) repeat protein